MTRMTGAFWACLLTVALSLAVAGCGKKPGSVTPPEGAEGGHYKRVYPPE